MTDIELLEQIADNGDRLAFAEVYRKYHRMLYVYAVRLLKDDEAAADIVQDVFVKFFEHASMIKTGDNLKGYLCTMTHNRAMNYIRTNNSRITLNYVLASRGPVCEDDSGLEDDDSRVFSKALDEAIDSLPQQQKIVVSLRRSGLSNREIAERLNLALGTVNIHWRLGTRQIRRSLSELLITILILKLKI